MTKIFKIKRNTLTIYTDATEESVKKELGIDLYYSLTSNFTKIIEFSYYKEDIQKSDVMKLRRFFYDNFPYILSIDTDSEFYISISFQIIETLYVR